MKLDLGGTAGFENPEDIILARDGTDGGDETTPLVIADYNRAPLPDQCADGIFGSCYFETPWDLKELARIMKPGATAMLGSCDTFASSAELSDRLLQIILDAMKAGLVPNIVEPTTFGSVTDEYGEWLHPWFLLEKEKEST